MPSPPLPFAFFRHADGRWYRLWMTRSPLNPERGHAWHLHATFDRSGTIAPVAGTRWFEQLYGMANWDFDEEPEAVADFQERAAERLAHGYELREGAIAEEES